MKKLLIALLALTVVGAVFAADPAPAVAFSGSFNTGLVYDFGDDTAGTDDDAVLYLMGKDSGKAGYRLRLDGSFAMENAGAKFRYENMSQTGAMTMDYAYAWADFANKMVNVKAGLIDDSAWGSKGAYDTDYMDIDGVLVQVKPVAGLNVGFGIAPLAAVNAVGTYPTTTEPGDAIIILGGSYMMDKVFAASANFLMQTGDPQKVLLSAWVLAVPNLTAVAEVQLTGLAEFADTGFMGFGQKVEYVMGPAKFGVKAKEGISNIEDSPLGLSVNPYVEYTMDKWMGKFSFTYLSAENALIANEDVTAMTIEPSVTYNFTAKAKIVTTFQYVLKDEPADTDNNTSKLYLDFIWSF